MTAVLDDPGLHGRLRDATTIAARRTLAASLASVRRADLAALALSTREQDPRLSARAAQVARRLPDETETEEGADTFRLEAHAWIAQEDYAAALRRLRRCRVDAGSQIDTAQCLIGLGLYERAQEYLDKMQLGAQIARANLEYARGRFDECLAALDAALAEPWGPPAKFAVRMNRTSVFRELGQFDAASKDLDQCEEIAHDLGPRAERTVRFHRAVLDLDAGRFGPALRQLEALLPDLEREEPYRHAYGLLRSAELYLHVHMPVHAESLADQACEAFHRMARPTSEANALFFRGTARREQGELEKARADLQRAHDAYARIGYRQWEAISLLRLAQVDQDLGEAAQAEAFARRAAETLREYGLDERAGQAELVVAEIEHGRGDLETARGRLVRILESTDVDAAPWLHCAVLRRIAQWDDHRPDDALRHVLRAVELVERHRHVVPPDECMAAFLEEKSGAFVDAVRWTLQAGGEQVERQVFDLVERSRSRALLDRLDTSDPADALRRETEALRARLPDAQSPERIEHSRSRRARLREREEALRSRGGGATASTVDAASLDEVRASIAPGDVLYEWFRMDDALLRIRLTTADIHVHVHSFTIAELEGLLGRLGLHVNRPSLMMPGFMEMADRLADDAYAVLTDVGAALFEGEPEPSQWKRMIVVPSGALHQVPFGALHVHGKPLVDTLSVTTSPSASIYERCIQRIARTSGEPLLVGAADWAAPEIRGEIDDLAARVGPSVALAGDEANRDAVRNALASARLVHIAAHARYEADDPFDSGFELSDGWFTLRHLKDLSMAPELVTLAGCATGRVSVSDSEEVFGLARGFLAAGARSLLATLWPVGDASTRKFMKDFYSAYATHGDASEAHRTATSSLRAEYRHPFYWAPFVLMGAGNRSESA